MLKQTTGYKKTLHTVLSCANGTKLTQVFKRKTLHKERLMKGVFVHVNTKGWMDGEVVGG